MHPLFATRLALPAYLLTWLGLAAVPGAVLGRSASLGRARSSRTDGGGALPAR